MDPLARKVATRFASIRNPDPGQLESLATVSIDGSDGGTNISFDEFRSSRDKPRFRMQVKTLHYATSSGSELDLPTEWVVDRMIAGLMTVRTRMAELRAAGEFSSYYDNDGR